MNKKHVAVLMGGFSSERPVSLSSGTACADALEAEGYRVTRVDVGRDVGSVLAALKPDVAFNALHGPFGEDGMIQGVLEFLQVRLILSHRLPALLHAGAGQGERVVALGVLARRVAAAGQEQVDQLDRAGCHRRVQGGAAGVPTLKLVVVDLVTVVLPVVFWEVVVFSVVCCAGEKSFLNCSTCGTLPARFPVVASTGMPIR